MGNLILIIDDEEVVLDACAQILEGSGYQLATATTGAQGVQRAQELRPDLVFVDLKMPGLSGFEVLEQLHALDPTLVTIVITGYATVSSAVEAMKKGAYDFLPKPFTPDEFRLIARRGLEKRQLVLETMALRREKERLREHFAAMVSHELKAPLGTVQQNLYGLRAELADQLTAEQQRRLDRLQANIDDLLKLILTWLRVITKETREIQENFQPVSVPETVAKAVESVQPYAVRKALELVTEAEASAGQVLGDEGTLTEIWVNLLTNAIKYSQTGGRVLIRIEERAAQLYVTVADQGVGIAAEDLPYIFDDLYMGRVGLRLEAGSGLGLAIARRLVEAHRGTISVKSRLGQGSTFEVRLPVWQP